MKKSIVFILLCACIICLFVGCTAQNSTAQPDATAPPNAPNAGPPAIMVDDILYYSTGEEIPVEIDESEFLGRIISTVSISQMPTENGQANIPFEDAPYAKYEDGIVLLMDEKWTLFETRD